MVALSASPALRLMYASGSAEVSYALAKSFHGHGRAAAANAACEQEFENWYCGRPSKSGNLEDAIDVEPK